MNKAIAKVVCLWLLSVLLTVFLFAHEIIAQENILPSYEAITAIIPRYFPPQSSLNMVMGGLFLFTTVGVVIWRYFSWRSWQQLQMAEARYRAIIEDQTELICRFRGDGVLTFVNEAYCRYFQKTKAELINKSFFTLIPPEDLPKITEKLKTLSLDTPIIHVEHKVISPDGEIRWQQWTDRIIVDGKGNILEYQSVGRDITELKEKEEAIKQLNESLEERVRQRTAELEREFKHRQQIEAELRQTYARYRRFVEGSPALLYEYSRQRGGIYYSPRTAEALGYDLDYLSSHPLLWQNSIHPEDISQAMAALTKFWQGQDFIIEYRIRDAQGKWHWFCDRSIGRREEGDDIILEGLAVDITEYKETELALDQAYKQLTFHVNNSLVAVIKWNNQGKIICWSPQAEKIFGWTEAEVLGKNWRDWQFVYELDQEQVTQIESDLSASRTPYNFSSNRNYTKDGRIIYCEWYNSILKDDQGQIISILSLVLDVSDRQEAETALQASQERLQLALNASGTSIWEFDFATGKLTHDRLWIEKLGYQIGEIEFDREWWRSQIEPDSLEKLNKLFKKYLKNPQGYFICEYQIKTKSGQWLWIEVRGKVIAYDQENKPLKMLGVNQDISERKKIEEEIRERERQLTTLISNLPGVVYRCRNDEDWTMIFVSESIEELTGYRASDFLEHLTITYTQIIHPEDRIMIRQSTQKAILNRQPFDIVYRIITATGEEKWVFERGRGIFSQTGELEFLEGFIMDITERKQAEEQLKHDAIHDYLTGLPNRILLTDRIEQAIKRYQENNKYLFAILFIDLDRFKVVNDSLGHLMGDELLKLIANTLVDFVSPVNTIARFGGDEFVILLENLNTWKDATAIAEEISEQLKRSFSLNEQEIFTSVSIGITFPSSENLNPVEMLRNADLAMYRAKEYGRSGYAIFDPIMDEQATRILELETSLRWAIERQELAIHYQPIVDLKSRKLWGFEALIRWNHPDKGLVPPSEFIPLAEETGLIISLGEWILLETCHQIKTWLGKYPQQKIRVSVNLSSRQLRQSNLIETIDSILQATGLDGSYLKLELTESMLMHNRTEAIKLLSQIRQRKIQVSIDDFGTGYSSLSYLHYLPIDTLKIDRSFVARMSEMGENFEIVEAIVTLAHHLEMDVVAEGVETELHLEQLKALGCEYGQGYYFAKPVDSEKAEDWLKQEL